MFWVKHHIEHLRNWRRAVEAVAKAVEDLKLDAEVYVFGGAAENRLTVLSDIDVLICVRKEEGDFRELKKKILIRAMDKYNLPWDYPIELHVHPTEEISLFKGKIKPIKVHPQAEKHLEAR